MASTAHSTHLPALGAHQREKVGLQLQALGELDAASQDVVIEAVRGPEGQLLMIDAQFPDARAY
jgi:hypothetical protein